MTRDYLHWESPHLERRMELLWFGDRGTPIVTFPTSMGRFYQYEDFGLVGALAEKIESGQVQLCCLDSVDSESWYDRAQPSPARVRRHDLYDRYVRDEVFPFVAERSGHEAVTVFGASFGAYHAMNVACRHSERVRKVIAFSGIFDIRRYLDGYWDELCHAHCPATYVPAMNDTETRRFSKIEIVVATGEHDHLAPGNREFLAILADKGIPATGEIWPGVFGHDWPFWAEHIRRFVP